MSNKPSKSRREAERRAKARRESLERKLKGELDQGARQLPGEPPLRSLGDTSVPRRQKTARFNTTSPLVASAWVLIGSLLAAVTTSVAVVGSTPVVGGTWDWKGLLWLFPAILGAWAVRRYSSGAALTTRVVAFISVVVVAVAFVLGSSGQVVVGGSAQLKGSVGDRSHRLAVALLNDMLVLEGNQKLLNLPAEQARGVFDLYAQAAVQSSDIAAKWNPVVAGDVPLPGFIQVLQQVNEAADLQSRALMAYADDLQQPDPARYQQIIAMRDRVVALLAGSSGAAAILDTTVAPLGIKLEITDGVVS